MRLLLCGWLLAAPSCAANFKSIEELAASLEAPEVKVDPSSDHPVMKEVEAFTSTVSPALISQVATEAKDAKAEQEAPRYGPAACVRTFKDKTSNTCVVKTKCHNVAGFVQYDMGFRCAEGDKDETATVHLFGVMSFAEEETFDTQIACGRCLPLEKSYETVSDLETQVLAMRQNLAEISSKQPQVPFSGLRGSQEAAK